MKLRTVIVGSGSMGGSGKTFSLVMLAFVLTRLGYRINYIDADKSNRTFTKVFKQEAESGQLTQVDLDKPGDFQQAILGCKELDDDVITIIDMPGSKTDFFVDYFEKRKPEDFAKVGIRLIFSVSVCNTAISLQGIRDILRICMGSYSVFALKSNMANLKGSQFDLQESKTGKALASIANDRVIEIEQLAPTARQEYDKLPAAPNEFEIGGRAATKLGLTHLSAMEWIDYSNKAVANVLPFAEWITGMPIPNPPKVVKPKASPAINKLIEDMDDDDL